MIGVVLFVGALTITWVRISGVYMRNNKLAGPDRPYRQSGPVLNVINAGRTIRRRLCYIEEAMTYDAARAL